jgi:3-phosphoshikimate 1-carboxyvinyltransferase
VGPDSLTVEGEGAPPKGAARIATRLDHRIAMAFLTFGIGAREPIGVDDAAPIETSFPGFVSLMNGIGADIVEPQA